MDINKLVTSNKVSFGKKGFKYFIGYKDTKKIRPLYVFLPKMSAHRKDFNETKYVCSLIKDGKLLKKYNEILEKITNIIYKECDSNIVYNEKYIKTNIKSYNEKIIANFHDNKTSKEGSKFIF